VRIEVAGVITVATVTSVHVTVSVTALITAVITDTITALTNGQLEWAVGTYGSTATLAIG
jgi:hypothetical protein